LRQQQSFKTKSGNAKVEAHTLCKRARQNRNSWLILREQFGQQPDYNQHTFTLAKSKNEPSGFRKFVFHDGQKQK